jgi:integrase
LCSRYFASSDFKVLSERTRKVRRQIIETCLREPIAPDAVETFADFPLSELTAKAIRVLRDRKTDYPEAANARLKAVRQVFPWAIENDENDVTGNPARDVKYVHAATGGFYTWTADEVAKFQERHPIGSKARLALALFLFTGARRSDVVRLGRQNVSDGWLRFREAKGAAHTVKERELPVLPELQDVIDKTETGHLTFLVTEFGAPFTSAGFGNWFADRCKEAGVPGRAHGLRKAGATIAAENGATEHQLMAIFGWTTAKQAGGYTRKANRKKLAGDAMRLLVRPSAVGKSGL